MKFPAPIPVKDIAKRFGAKLIGDDSLQVTGINEIHKVVPGDIMFVDHPKYYTKSIHSAASVIIIDQEAECPNGKALLVIDNPFEVYDKLVREHRPFQPLSAAISDSALIHPSAILEPNVVIGPHVRIGKNCYIQANVTIAEHTIIGDYVTIQSGCAIGTDAFYFQHNKDGFKKWRSGGRVVIEDHVEIGACCTINKGASGDTVIGEGTKFDCQIHIGHGAVVGKRCMFAAQVGIGGKTIIEDDVKLYGQVGVAQNLHIGKGTIVLAKSGVSKNLKGGKTYFGSPAAEVKTKYKELAALRQLPNFLKTYFRNNKT